MKRPVEDADSRSVTLFGYPAFADAVGRPQWADVIDSGSDWEQFALAAAELEESGIFGKRPESDD